MEIREISFVEILDSPQAEALLKEYSAECSIPEIGKPDPQRQSYALMENTGVMHSFGVFEAKLLIGFATILIFTLPHYGKRIANVESLFIANSCRQGMIGKKFMEHLEGFAKKQKCCGLLYNARAGSRLELLLGILPEYKRTNSVFLRSMA